MKAFPINLDCFDVKTSSIMGMTKLDRSYVMCTVVPSERLSDHVKLARSYLSCRTFSILLLQTHQFCFASGALF